MFRWIVLFACALSLFSLSCATKTILVPEGDPVQLRKEIRSAPVWVYDELGKRVETNMTIPAGWWCLPDVYVEDKE